MLKIEKKQFLLVGAIFEAMTLILLFIGIRGVLGNELMAKNIIGFVVFSTIVGLVAALLVYFNLKIILTTYILGYIIGFLQMFGSFFKDMSGWGNLIGIISLFMWLIIGLGSGLIIQLGVYFYKKLKKS